MKKTFIIILIHWVFSCPAQNEEYDQFVLQSSLPDEIRAAWFNRELDNSFLLSNAPNPFYLRGDFDGDSDLDYALSVIHKNNRKHGIIVFFSNVDYQIIGAGKALANREIDDFQWMDAWSVYPKKEVGLGVGESEKLSLNSEAILAIKTESASGIIYWDGTVFKWYQQGD